MGLLHYSDGLMVIAAPPAQHEPIVYPSSDGEPFAETSIHLDAIIAIVISLRQFLGEPAIVFSNQFLYYAHGYPRLRVAPDSMVIFGVAPGSCDNYNTWEEGEIPTVVSEITSGGTREQYQSFKKILYEQPGIPEYWQFDPKGEWIPEQLWGYRLRGDSHELIADSMSDLLQLRLQVEGYGLTFYRLDTGEKLLVPDEMAVALRNEIRARREAKARAEQAEQSKRSAVPRLLAMGLTISQIAKALGMSEDEARLATPNQSEP